MIHSTVTQTYLEYIPQAHTQDFAYHAGQAIYQTVDDVQEQILLRSLSWIAKF